MFKASHITQLHPIIKRRHAQSPPLWFSFLSKNELESPLFPKYFVEMSNAIVSNRVQLLQLRSSQCGVDGKFIWDDSAWNFRSLFKAPWNGQPKEFFIEQNESFKEDWTIVARNTGEDDDSLEQGTVLWMSPHSSSLSTPPFYPWIPVDSLAHTGGEVILSTYVW